MTPEERDELLAGYALGTLSAPDAADVERLLTTDAHARAELESYHEIVDLIALSVPLRRADPSLRSRVLRAARTGGVRRRPRIELRRYVPAAAAVAAILVLGSWGLSMQSTIEDLRAQTTQLAAVVESDAKRLEELTAVGVTVEQQRAITLQLQSAIEDQVVLAAVAADPNARTTELQPTSAAHGAGGRYVWSDEADAGVLYVHHMPPIGIAHTFQIWLEDAASRSVFGGTFDVDVNGEARVVVKPDGPSQPVRIYIYATSKGDRESPDGPTILIGTITRGGEYQQER